MDSGRLRSQSAGSAGVLLGRAEYRPRKQSMLIAMCHQVILEVGAVSQAPTTLGRLVTFSFYLLQHLIWPGTRSSPNTGLATTETADPYYRPHVTRSDIRSVSPGAKSRDRGLAETWRNKRWSEPDSGLRTRQEGPSISGRDTPIAPQALDGSPGRTQAD